MERNEENIELSNYDIEENFEKKYYINYRNKRMIEERKSV